MSEPTENFVRHDPPTELPPVEPPSARFIVQLFVIPAAIVIVLVVAYVAFVQLPFGRLANGGRDVMDYVRSIKGSNENRRWRSAYELASLIQNDGRLAKDGNLLGELTVALDGELAKPKLENPELAEYLALSLGAFQTTKSNPVDGRSTDPIATLSNALGPKQPRTVRVAAAISLSRLAERAGGSFGDPTAVHALAAASASAEDSAVRQRASYALGYFSGDEALAALRRRMSDEEDRVVYYNAGAALARRGDPEAARVLKEMLSPADLAQTLKASTPSETQTAIEAVELEALWGLQASVTSHPDLTIAVKPQLETLAKTAAPAVRIEAQNLLKKLP
ncbi:MAG: hypothetical protein JWN86_3170 [Planctomycetota bacterium]|nr:hypothetical protein [Planctomycetota bacterium]